MTQAPLSNALTALRKSLLSASAAHVLPYAARAAAAAALFLQARTALLTPIFIGIGIALYFNLLIEPALIIGFGASLLAFVFYLLCRGRPLFGLVGFFIFLTALGFLSTQLRAYVVYAPQLTRNLDFVLVRGMLVDVSPQTQSDARLIIAPSAIGNLKSSDLPRRVRITAHKLSPLPSPGQIVELRASLMPPSGPVMPGGFDFARQAYFSGLGAVGYSWMAPQILPPQNEHGVDQRISVWLAKLRLKISTRIFSGLPGENGALATALITGYRDAIPEDIVDDLRDSGLAHLLSISGVHMVLFAGAVFLLCRTLFALIPFLALRWPVKKWAAFLSLMSATGYLLISGAEVATQRSYIMIALMLGSILVDRAALTLRNVALAATLILLFLPESLLNVGFQMSFAAVLALVSGWEWAHERENILTARGGVLTRFRTYLLGIVATSVWAGLATAPFAAYHFNRISDYTLLADLVVSPVMALIVMPAAFATLAAMPFALEQWPLGVMGWGINVIKQTSAYVASLPGAVHYVPSGPPLALTLFVGGGLYFLLAKGRWRLIGIIGPFIAVLLTINASHADMYVSREGKNFAVRAADGRLVSYAKRADAYSLEQWLRQDGDSRMPAEAFWKTQSTALGWSCDKLGCLHRHVRGPLIAYVLNDGALIDDCAHADVVIARFTVRGCKGPNVVIDGRALRQGGAHALWFEENRIRVRRAEDERGARYWTGAAPSSLWTRAVNTAGTGRRGGPEA